MKPGGITRQKSTGDAVDPAKPPPIRASIGGHRRRDAVALAGMAAELHQPLACAGVSRLGHHLAGKVRQRDHALDDGLVLPVLQHLLHEGAVDLQLVERQPLPGR